MSQRGAVCVVLLALLACKSDPKAEANNRLPIIDTHQHLWDLKNFELPWLAD